MTPKIETHKTIPVRPRAVKPLPTLALGAKFKSLNLKGACQVIDRTIQAFPSDRLLVVVDGVSGTGKTHFCQQLKTGRYRLSRPTSQIIHLAGDALHDLIEKAANGLANNRNLRPQYQWPFENRTAYQRSGCPEYTLAKYFELNHHRLFGLPPANLVLYDCTRSSSHIRGMVECVDLFETNPPSMIGLFVRLVPRISEVPELNWFNISVEEIG